MLTRDEYLENLWKAYDEGRLSEEALDAGIANVDIFCTDDEEYYEDWC